PGPVAGVLRVKAGARGFEKVDEQVPAVLEHSRTFQVAPGHGADQGVQGDRAAPFGFGSVSGLAGDQAESRQRPQRTAEPPVGDAREEFVPSEDSEVEERSVRKGSRGRTRQQSK